MAALRSLEWLVDALSRPGVLPESGGHPPDAVHQTHASVVLVCGARAWKLKKPIDLGFLDFTTVAARERNAREEVRLNRRLAPAIYLGVRAVVRRGDGVAVVETPTASDEVLDWLVEMARLPAEGMFDRVLATSRPAPDLVRTFARELAEFHGAHPLSAEVERHGSVASVDRRVRENLGRLAEHATRGARSALPRAFVDAIAAAAVAWLARIAAALERRRAGGRVREGHGDLHARNLCVVDGRLVAYDCLEFEAAFRCADVASEVGFLAMDLDVRGRPDLATAFVDAYIAASGDVEVRSVERFFRLHYAVIRAMVDAIRLGQRETGDGERDAVVASVRAYASFAAGYAVEPALVILSGLPATGKSTVARSLARPLRAAVVRSDEVRKRLAGLAPTDRGDAALYSAAQTASTYDEVERETGVALASRRSAIVDAANLRRADRRRFVDLARRHGVRWLVVETHADEGVVRERMRTRGLDRGEASDATFSTYQRLRETAEPITEVPEPRLVRLRGGDDLFAPLTALLALGTANVGHTQPA